MHLQPDRTQTSKQVEELNAMLMLTEQDEVVIGVDTHRDTLTASVIDTVSGGAIETVTVATTPAGYSELIDWARRHVGD
jgi:transposase